VQDLYLEHALELTAHEVARGVDWARSRPGAKGGILSASTLTRADELALRNAPLSERDDEILTIEELRERYHVKSGGDGGSGAGAAKGGMSSAAASSSLSSSSSTSSSSSAVTAADSFSESTVQALYALDHTSINFALIVDLIVWFVRQRQQQQQPSVAAASDVVSAPSDLFWGDDTDALSPPPPLVNSAPAPGGKQQQQQQRRPASASAAAASGKGSTPSASASNVSSSSSSSSSLSLSQRIAAQARGLDGAILVFLPGLKEITALYELLLATPAIAQACVG
jgi:hypothetical protein